MRRSSLILATGLAYLAAVHAQESAPVAASPPATETASAATAPVPAIGPLPAAPAPIVPVPGADEPPASTAVAEIPQAGPSVAPAPAAEPPAESSKPADPPPPPKPLPLLSDLVRGVLDRNVRSGVWPAVVAATVGGGDVATAGFGHLDDGEGPAPGDATRFQLGGVTAAYTGLLLADLAASGKVRLSDPIDAFLPAGATCADARICAITLGQLASGRSGLPPLPANLFPRDSRDPLRDYGEAELLAFLASYRPAQWPTPATESPLADGLLGWALGRAHGDGYAAALRERVLTPLGLTATGFDDADLAPGHAGGSAARAAHFGILAGAGALRSTASDQIALLKAMLRPNETPLRNALLLARQAQTDDGDRGLGWRLAFVESEGQNWPIVWQRGESGGHASFIGFRTDRQQAVVLFGGSTADLSALGLSMLRGDGVSGAPAMGLAQNPENLDEYAGLYSFAPDREVVVRARNGILSVQLPGQLAVRLSTAGEDTFATADAAIQVFFLRGAGRRVEGLRWTQEGYNVPAERLSDKAPQVERAAWPIAPDALAAICGDYFVDANVVARLACVRGEVYFQLTGANERAIVLYAPDRFASADGEIELRVNRDAAGKPVGIVLGLLGKELDLPRIDANGTVTPPAKPAPAKKPRHGKDAD